MKISLLSISLFAYAKAHKNYHKVVRRYFAGTNFGRNARFCHSASASTMSGRVAILSSVFITLAMMSLAEGEEDIWYRAVKCGQENCIFFTLFFFKPHQALPLVTKQDSVTVLRQFLY